MFAVALGGAVGAVLRWALGLLLNKHSFPWGTLAVNLVGSLVIGFVVFWAMKQKWPEPWALFVVTGVLGGFTTFSAFSLENLQMVQDGKLGLALAYGLGSPALGLMLAYLGFTLAQKLAG